MTTDAEIQALRDLGTAASDAGGWEEFHQKRGEFTMYDHYKALRLRLEREYREAASRIPAADRRRIEPAWGAPSKKVRPERLGDLVEGYYVEGGHTLLCEMPNGDGKSYTSASISVVGGWGEGK